MNGPDNNGFRDSQKIAQIMSQHQLFKWFIGILTSLIVALLFSVKSDVNSVKSDVNRNEQTINEMNLEMNIKISRIERDLSWVKSLLKPSVSGQIGKD